MPSIKELMDKEPGDATIMIMPAEAFKEGIAPWSPITSQMTNKDWEEFFEQIRPEFKKEAPIGN